MVSRGGIWYIYVCYCDMFSVVNVYLEHLKFCVVCINSRRYVCCSESDVVSNECVAFPNSKHGGAGYTGRLFRRRSHVQFSIQPYTY